jgi:hypothetical protein
MIDNFVIISKHEISPLRKGKWTPSVFFEAQDYFALRVDKTNEDYLQEFIKFSIDEIKTIKESGIIGKTKIDSTVISCPAPFAMKVLPTGEKLFKRHGSYEYDENDEAVNPFIEIPAGEARDYDIEIAFPLTKLQGVDIIGAGDLHSCEFFVILDDPQAGEIILNQFGFNSAINKDFHKFESAYDADIPQGLILRTTIFNWSSEASNVAINLDLNEVVK